MKRILSTILLFTFIIYSFQACKKDQNKVRSNTSDQDLIASAKKYFQDNLQHSKQTPSGLYRIDAEKTINWQTAQISNLSNGPAVIVAVSYLKNLYIKTNLGDEKLFSLNELVHVIIYKDKANNYHAELITAFPDTVAIKSSANRFSGILFVENWVGQRIHQFKYTPNGSILRFQGSYTTHAAGSKINTSDLPVHPDMIITTCYQINGYNYSEDNPSEGYAWSESAGCTSLYIPESADGGGGSDGGGGLSGSDYGSAGGPSAPATNLAITRGPNAIANVQDYFKCFSNVGGTDHTYTVTVCIDQPTPGTREPWRFQNSPNESSAANNAFDVGHTFLIFSETYGGNTITRNVGFYPHTGVTPWYPSDQGQLNDNESSTYNISLTLSINNAQFFNMLNYVSQGNNPGYSYNLNSNNCTTFAIDALQAGSVNLSSQFGTWFKGRGYDPGDLGEDIRDMSLSSNMSRNTVENPHPNVGNCN